MKRFALHSLLLIPVVLACSDQANPDISFQFRETPLRQLQGVEIGMPAKDLKRARPGARYSPYLGMQETIPGYRVSYQFNQVMNETQGADVPPADRLQAIYVAQLFDSDEAASVAWKEEVAALIGTRGKPDFCESVPSGGRQAGWTAAGLSLVVGVFSPERNSTSVGSRVLTAISIPGNMKKPAAVTPMPCPTR